MSPTPPAVIKVDPAAGRFLDLLVELGHLDDRLLGEVNDLLLATTFEDGRVRIEDVKRLAAGVLVDHMEQMDPEYQRVLREEWAILFS